MIEKHDFGWAAGRMKLGHRVQRQDWDNTTMMFMEAEEKIWYVSTYIGSSRKQWVIHEVAIEDAVADDWEEVHG